MDRLKLHTICEEARCPNRWECWNARTATFLILGDICTRRCHYCSVETGRPLAIDLEEPRRVAEAIHALGLRHAVITSVNRDELSDGGAAIFSDTIRKTRQLSPDCTIEVLIPDFEGNEDALAMVCAEKPEIVNHNIETVRRLFPAIRPQGKYQRSIELLDMAKQFGMHTKSGLILGMGETMNEAREVMRDLRSVDCNIMTIGQYLQPTKEHLPVARFYDPDEFVVIKRAGDGARLHSRRIRPPRPQFLPCRATSLPDKCLAGEYLKSLKKITNFTPNSSCGNLRKSNVIPHA